MRLMIMFNRSFLLYGAIATLVIFGAGLCFAQEFRYSGEIFGAVGFGRTYDDEGSLGSGLNGGGGIGYRIRSKFGLEFELSGFRHERETSFGSLSFAGHGVFATGNALYYFGSGSGRVQPYIIGGAGLLHKRNTSSFEGQPPLDIWGTGLALNIGTGANIFPVPRFSIRPVFRIFSGKAGSAVEAPFSVIRASVGLAYHW